LVGGDSGFADEVVEFFYVFGECEEGEIEVGRDAGAADLSLEEGFGFLDGRFGRTRGAAGLGREGAIFRDVIAVCLVGITKDDALREGAGGGRGG